MVLQGFQIKGPYYLLRWTKDIWQVDRKPGLSDPQPRTSSTRDLLPRIKFPAPGSIYHAKPEAWQLFPTLWDVDGEGRLFGKFLGLTQETRPCHGTFGKLHLHRVIAVGRPCWQSFLELSFRGSSPKRSTWSPTASTCNISLQPRNRKPLHPCTAVLWPCLFVGETCV